VELYLYSPNTLSWRGARLKHRDNYTFLSSLLFLTVLCLQNEPILATDSNFLSLDLSFNEDHKFISLKTTKAIHNFNFKNTSEGF
jgi:hypothetical protein